MSQSDATPKLHIDSDWKAQAQTEKERLAKQEQEKAKSAPHGQGAEGELPPADFRTLVGMLAQQAIMGLGAMADQKTGRVIIDLEGSRFAIDMLDVLEQKTKGNLTAEESSELKQVLAELRSRFVQISTLVARQMAQGAAGPASVTGGGGAAPDLVIDPASKLKI